MPPHNTTGLITLAIQIPETTAKLYIDADRPLPLEALPAMLREALGELEPDPRERFSELDELIAEILDDGNPRTADQVAQALERDLDHITSAAGVRDRFRSSRPLRAAGYTRTQAGYMRPSA